MVKELEAGTCVFFERVMKPARKEPHQDFISRLRRAYLKIFGQYYDQEIQTEGGRLEWTPS